MKLITVEFRVVPKTTGPMGVIESYLEMSEFSAVEMASAGQTTKHAVTTIIIQTHRLVIQSPVTIESGS
jgi:hypothetical protein